MNLFILDYCPIQAAQWSVDSHCGKILIETCQVMCIPFHLQGIKAPYKISHLNHPVSKWVRASHDNFQWTIEYAFALSKEFTARYNKEHKSTTVAEWCRKNCPLLNFPSVEMTPFAQAMPDEFRDECSVTAYRNYYCGAKRHLFKWKRNKPYWAE